MDAFSLRNEFCIRLLKAEKLAEFKHRPTEFARIALLFLTNGFVPTLSRLRCIWFVNLQTPPNGSGILVQLAHIGDKFSESLDAFLSS